MEKIVKQTREVGTSAGVLLPRSWLNKQVVVTIFSSSIKNISIDLTNILVERGLNEEAKGIYLFGSHARGDYDLDSDIDILIITKSVNKLIRHGNYEISLISEDKFSRDLDRSLIFLSALREAKVIFNKELLEKYKKKIKKTDFSGLLKEIRGITKINKEIVKFHEEKDLDLLDGTVYSIVLRLRELYLIRILLSGNAYNQSDFMKLVGKKNYLAYLRIKRCEKELNNISPDEVKEILFLSEKWLKELKG